MSVSHSGYSSATAAAPAVDRRSPLQGLRKPARRERRQRIEGKFAKNYADLQASVFEASQVHRLLCPPRLVRHGAFEIASEAFAARHLSGDFISVREAGDNISLTLGDISGKGFTAGMW